MIYVDMDGVLADFDSHYKAVFGIVANTKLDNVDWVKVRAVGNFYLTMPPMADFDELWGFIEPLSPTLLTGVPKSVAEAVSNKKAWAALNVGPDVPVICCRSSEKALHCRPGDILIDDWEKYKDKWVKAGGIWITHTSAADTIKQLKDFV